ncbi:hypothetical protein ZOSMA_269G00200 [Zostera marina]|uniref:Uncharacterized protein n=1 Tax=Zostera marina TaxID=29655 RepID=A0A0K9PEN0_ZOSMR|nr:hypothetical protein ZOSMA_269G00200 [Zostera marina]
MIEGQICSKFASKDWAFSTSKKLDRFYPRLGKVSVQICFQRLGIFCFKGIRRTIFFSRRDGSKSGESVDRFCSSVLRITCNSCDPTNNVHNNLSLSKSSD